MFDVNLDNEYLADIDGTSEGTQIKFHKDNYWYKLDSSGGEGIAEELCSKILVFSSITDKEYVCYESGLINKSKGCRSHSFLEDGEEFITLYRFYQLMTGEKLNDKVNLLNTPRERADFVLDFFQNAIDLDLSNYFAKIFTLDYIILNEDRHFNNLGFIRSVDGTYHEAPIFDNGKSLLVGNPSINRRLLLAENVKRTIARPFSGSFQKNMELFGIGFQLNIENCINEIAQYPACLEKEVLLFQLENCKNLFHE
ncbi:MAG: hypothetical protein K2G55_00420 [Lachnospiraceae bacterium]|nr:hypothetical protein [Lachnospiraceae bacterium]MDE7202064.1 hypothetical protein [Lachnospiraceae bacterium]